MALAHARAAAQLLDKATIDRYRNSGGFTMLASGRDKIETEEQFKMAVRTATNNRLDGLVVIGGDDSNTNACLLAERFAADRLSTRVRAASTPAAHTPVASGDSPLPRATVPCLVLPLTSRRDATRSHCRRRRLKLAVPLLPPPSPPPPPPPPPCVIR